MSKETRCERRTRTPESIRRTSAEITNRVNRQVKKPAAPLTRATTPTATRMKPSGGSGRGSSPMGRYSRPALITTASSTIQPRTSGVRGCGRSVTSASGDAVAVGAGSGVASERGASGVPPADAPTSGAGSVTAGAPGPRRRR
ncbi:MAG: hypothetical protein QM779_11890 [Propionicimonas sp.]